MKTLIKINPQEYTLSPIQFECFADEFCGRCMEIVRGDELEIEFDSIAAKNQFLDILNKTFKKNA